MKKIIILAGLIIFFLPCIVTGQLKSQTTKVPIKQQLTAPLTDQFLGLGIFDPSKFSMSHSISMSYFSIGGKGISQNLYLNTMSYQIASPLLLRVQWGIQNFPYNSLAKNHPLFQSGFFLSGAELQYKPNNKFEMRFQYYSLPGYMSNYYWYENSFRSYNKTIGTEEE